MTTNRTPRQAPGDGLTPVTVRLPLGVKQRLDLVARDLRRSTSSVAREALERYLWPVAPNDAA